VSGDLIYCIHVPFGTCLESYCMKGRHLLLKISLEMRSQPTSPHRASVGGELRSVVCSANYFERVGRSIPIYFHNLSDARKRNRLDLGPFAPPFDCCGAGSHWHPNGAGHRLGRADGPFGQQVWVSGWKKTKSRLVRTKVFPAFRVDLDWLGLR